MSRLHLPLIVALALLLSACAPEAQRSSSDSAAARPAAPPAQPASEGKTATPTPEPLRGVVVIDPGHGGPDDSVSHVLPDGGIWWEGSNTGIGRMLPDGQMLWEKDLTLRIAQAAAGLLRHDGYAVILTRTSDQPVNTPPGDLNDDGRIDLADELQARIDAVNAAHGDALLSIHFNAQENQTRSSTMITYCADRPFAGENRRLAELAHKHVRQALRDVGYDAPDEGIYDDADLDAPGRHLLLLGPPGPKNPRATDLPGALAEPLFFTDEHEFVLVARQDVQDAITSGLVQAIETFLNHETVE